MTEATRPCPPSVKYTAEFHQGYGPVECISFDMRRGDLVPAELCGVMAEAARLAAKTFLAGLES